MAAAASGERIRELVDMLGGEEALDESGRRFRANLEYLERHRDELTRQYPDRWIGIQRQQVRAHADSPTEVARMIGEAGDSLVDAVVRFMTTDDRPRLLREAADGAEDARLLRSEAPALH